METSNELTAEEFWKDYDMFAGGEYPNPVVMSKDIDLYLMYRSVLIRGGFESTCSDNSWRQVFLDCTTASHYSTNTGYYTKLVYERYLLAFEKSMLSKHSAYDLPKESNLRSSQMDISKSSVQRKTLSSSQSPMKPSFRIRRRNMDRPKSPRSLSPGEIASRQRGNRGAGVGRSGSELEDETQSEQTSEDDIENQNLNGMDEETWMKLHEKIEKLADNEALLHDISALEAQMAGTTDENSSEIMEKLLEYLKLLQEKYQSFEYYSWLMDKHIETAEEPPEESTEDNVESISSNAALTENKEEDGESAQKSDNQEEDFSAIEGSSSDLSDVDNSVMSGDEDFDAGIPVQRPNESTEESLLSADPMSYSSMYDRIHSEENRRASSQAARRRMLEPTDEAEEKDTDILRQSRSSKKRRRY